MLFEELDNNFCFNRHKIEPAKAVYICNGSDCTRRGGQHSLRRELEKYFSPDQIGFLNCLGLCQKNYAFRFDGKNFSTSNPAEIEQIIKKGSH